MSDVVIRVEGLEELKRRLEELEDGRLARAMIRTGSRDAAKVLLAEQQNTVPVEEGKLRDSLGIQVKGAKTDKLQVLVGADKKYNFIGRFHEFGTKKMQGIHWTQKAWESSCNDALSAFVNKVRQLLDKKLYSDLKSAIEDALSGGDDE
jgi:HK97 gp10 family phage protein